MLLKKTRVLHIRQNYIQKLLIYQYYQTKKQEIEDKYKTQLKTSNSLLTIRPVKKILLFCVLNKFKKL